MKRREFLKKASIGTGSLAALNLYNMAVPMEVNALSTSGGIGIEEALYILEKGKAKNLIPEIRPEIKRNPRTVFLIETHVDAAPDKDGFYTEAVPQLEAAGKNVAEQLFVKGSEKGGSTAIKPNFTYVPEHYYNRTNGVYSSPDFIVGLIEHLREIENSNVICGERMPNGAKNHRQGGVYEAFDAKDVTMLEANYAEFAHHEKNDLNWSRTSGSLIWKNIPHFRPIGDKDNFFINVATLKVHTTSITTLAVKNLQGCVPTGYGYMCYSWDGLENGAGNWGIPFKRDFHRDYYQRIEESYRKHLNAGFKKWDRTGSYKKYLAKGGWDAFRKVKDNTKARDEFMNGVGSLMREEMWLQRGLDNASVLKPDINIIEGIIGLDGNQHNLQRIGHDQLCNIVIAGISAFEVDAVGTYIMGHDPREVWYTRVAKERSFGECDVNKIEINWIRNGEIIPIKNLTEIKRHPLGLNWAFKDDPDQRLFW